MKRLKRTQYIKLIAFGLCMSIAHLTFTYSNSSPPSGYTGAPNESHCTSCHSGTVITSGAQFDSVKLDLGTGGLQYTPSTTYHATISFNANNQNKYGFQAVALINSNNTNAGSITVTNSTKTKKLTRSVSSSTREYITHTSQGVTGSSGYIEWEFDWTAPSSNVGTVKFYVAIINSNRDGTDKNDKNIERSFEIKHGGNQPVASIKTSVPNACVGDTVEFFGSATKNPTSYKWVFPNGTPSTSTSKNVQVVFNKSGTQTVSLTATNSAGSGTPKTLAFKVKALPDATVKPSGSLTICAEDSVTLSPLAGTSWKWSNGEISRTLNVKKAGTYSVEITNPNGCSVHSQDFTVSTIKPYQPTLSSNTNSPICEDDKLSLIGDTELLNFSLFNHNSKLSDHSTTIFDTSPGAGSYAFRIVGEAKNGCLSDTSNTLNFVFKPKTKAPEIHCDSSTSDFLFISWDSIANAKSYEVSIDSGKTWLPPSHTDGSNRHTLGGLGFSTVVDFRVRAIEDGPCNWSQAGQKACKTNVCFKVRYQLAINDTLCQGDSLKVKISKLNLRNYSLAFNDQGYSDKLDFAMLPIGDQKLKLSFVDSLSLSCPPEDTLISVDVFEYPKPEITHNWPSVINDYNRICESETDFELSHTQADSNGAFTSWEWQGPGVKKMGDGTFTFSADDAGVGTHQIYSLVSNTAGCVTQLNEQIEVSPMSSVEIDYVANDSGKVVFKAVEKNVNRRSWDFGDGNQDTAKSPIHIFDTNGTYQITLMGGFDPSGCPQESVTEMITILNASLSQLGKLDFSMFPNPTNGQITLNLGTNIQKGKIEILDISGQIIEQVEINQTAFVNLDVSSLNKGSYLLILSTNNGIGHKVLIKQ